jgi:single-strand DNA-binding protein
VDMNTTIVGNLTDDPELRFTPSGAAVVKFTIAHNQRVKRGDEWVDGEPTFVSCTAWRQLAENIAESLTRGARVILAGRLRTERWDDKASGEKRSRIVLDVQGCGPELSFATATVRKMSRNGAPGDDQWSQASRTRPAAASSTSPASSTAPADSASPAGATWDDEPPF